MSSIAITAILSMHASVSGSRKCQVIATLPCTGGCCGSNIMKMTQLATSRSQANADSRVENHAPYLLNAVS